MKQAIYMCLYASTRFANIQILMDVSSNWLLNNLLSVSNCDTLYYSKSLFC